MACLNLKEHENLLLNDYFFNILLLKKHYTMINI